MSDHYRSGLGTCCILTREEFCNFSIISGVTLVSCLASFHLAVSLLARKTLFAILVVLAIIGTADYLLFSFGTARSGIGGQYGGFLGSLSIRTLVILSVVGGSAFITGFGLRDVIGRAAAARQRSRLQGA